MSNQGSLPDAANAMVPPEPSGADGGSPGPPPPLAPTPGSAPSPAVAAPSAPPPPAAPKSRSDLVREASATWANQLIDIGGRNNLLFYRDLRAGTLDLTTVDPLSIDGLLAGRTVRLSSLFLLEPQRRDAMNRARTIHARARENDEERGITTLYIALGLATWTPVRGTATPAAPILLRPAELRPRGAAQDDFELQATGEMEVNPILLHTLRTDFGRSADAEALLAQLDGAIDTRAEAAATYDWLHLQADGVRGFSMADRVVLGNFLYAKLPMVRDIETSQAAIEAHDLLSAVAGDATARTALRHRDETAAAVQPPDSTPPSDEFLVLDADASQHEAVNRILAGQDLIIKGPPGTGKSQTIANLIASLLARDQKVLFVAEKRAAIDAVFKRLNRVGLADMILDIHGGVRSRRALADDLARSLAAASQAAPVDVTALSTELATLRARLNDTARALHVPRDPWAVTIYGARARLDELPRTAATVLRFRGDQIRAMGRPRFDVAMASLRRWLELGGLRLPASSWAAAPIDTPDAALGALDDVRALAAQTPTLHALLRQAAAETGLPDPGSSTGRRAAIERWIAARSFVATFTPEAASADLDRLVADVAPAASGAVGRTIAGVFSGRYRAARAQVRGLLRAPLSDENAQFMLVAARDLRDAWPAGAGTPRPPVRLDEIVAESQAFDATLARVVAATGQPHLATAEWPMLEQRLADLLRDADIVRKLPDLRRLDVELRAARFGPLIDEARAAGLSDTDALARAEYAWLRSVIDEVEFRDPLLATFDAETHTATIARFRAADRRHLEMNAARLVRIYAEHAVRARDAHPDEAAILKGQANRKRGHLPLRQLFGKAPNVLLAVKPCWAMSPLVVSQVLPGDRPWFDVVVFDEASQVTPADAVPALMRGRRVVVAGDNRQLPPTAFFLATAPEEEEREGEAADIAPLTGFESILDSLGPLLPETMLEWHYRSQDERLIAFSNGAFYDGRLTTFPGPAGSESLEHVLVNAKAVAADEESVHEEVREVVRRVIHHAETHPDQSLGVIAMGITHANRIGDALREELRGRADLDAFFAEDREEPFFVKNLERVQGDERDAIILSIGYGKGADGRLFYRFGPINMEGGERRLNVAITRARRHMTVISSFRASEMDPARVTRRGPALLRDYLVYAESGGSAAGLAPAGAGPTDGFETTVRGALAAAGLAVQAHLGYSREWIDLAVRDRFTPERYVLAVETDGPMYGRARTARDRDRLRQEQLERLGWAFQRAWSREWDTAPDDAVARLVEAAQPTAPVDLGEAAAPVVVAPEAAADPATDPSAGGEMLPVPGPPSGAVAPPPRGPRPRIPRYVSITEYPPQTLVALMTWLESDGLLRTEDEVIDEAMRELGFARHGSRIDAALGQALKVSRHQRAR